VRGGCGLCNAGRRRLGDRRLSSPARVDVSHGRVWRTIKYKAGHGSGSDGEVCFLA
jgi:hypothetical protein